MMSQTEKMLEKLRAYFSRKTEEEKAVLFEPYNRSEKGDEITVEDYVKHFESFYYQGSVVQTTSLNSSVFIATSEEILTQVSFLEKIKDEKVFASYKASDVSFSDEEVKFSQEFQNSSAYAA